MKRIAILCSGGDVSGMNAALKRFVEYTLLKGVKPFFVKRGYEGLIDDEIEAVSYDAVAGIITKGGTVIGSARSVRFMQEQYRKRAYENLRKRGIEAVVILGGDGSFKGMEVFSKAYGIACVGIPATIDNDIAGTEYCLGVDTALNVIKNAIDAVRDTASSFGRAFVIETMGRECGYLALVSALTSGAEMCLIPEIPYDLKSYKRRFLQERASGRDYFVAIVSEAIPEKERLVQWFEEEIGIEARATVLGHIQRGGNPTVYDRLTAYRFVTCAIDALLDGERACVICYGRGGFVKKSISEVAFAEYHIDEALLALGREYGRIVDA